MAECETCKHYAYKEICKDCHSNNVLYEPYKGSGWISVKDRLPEKDGEYLVFTEQRDCFNALFESEIGDGGEFGVWLNSYHPDTLGFLDSEWQEYEGITHWMPLPAPPEGE